MVLTNQRGRRGSAPLASRQPQFRALPPSPFRRYNPSPEVIRLVVTMYVRYSLSLGNVEDLLFKRGIDISQNESRRCSRTSPLPSPPGLHCVESGSR